MNEEILAIIPARGNSRGIARKNMRILWGRPLIEYQIQTAKESKYIEEIVVTSEDDKIIEFAKSSGVAVRKRPRNLSEDSVTLDPVVYDALEYMEKRLKKRYGVIVTLQPTSPCLLPSTVDAGIEDFLSRQIDTLIPVMDSTHLYYKEVDGRIVSDYDSRMNRQWLPRRLKECGAFLISSRSAVGKHSRIGEKKAFFFLNQIEGHDIDTPTDWLIAEAYLRRFRITFVTSGTKAHGFGHLHRVLAIADRMTGNEISIILAGSDPEAEEVFISRGYKEFLRKTDSACPVDLIRETKPQIVVNDILDTRLEYVKSLVGEGYFVVNFEDLGDGANAAHLVFNALYEKTKPEDTHRYGYHYECLSDGFNTHSPAKFRKTPRVLLVTFGGVDQNNLTCRVMEVCNEILTETTIRRIEIVVGAGYAHMSALRRRAKIMSDPRISITQSVEDMAATMRRADIAVTSNGRTIYELSAMAVPTISIAQNDRETMHLFARYHKGVRYLGIACTVRARDIFSAVKSLSESPSSRLAMYTAQIDAGSSIREGGAGVVDEITRNFRSWSNGNRSNR